MIDWWFLSWIYLLLFSNSVHSVTIWFANYFQYSWESDILLRIFSCLNFSLLVKNLVALVDSFFLIFHILFGRNTTVQQNIRSSTILKILWYRGTNPFRSFTHFSASQSELSLARCAIALAIFFRVPERYIRSSCDCIDLCRELLSAHNAFNEMLIWLNCLQFTAHES